MIARCGSRPIRLIAAAVMLSAGLTCMAILALGAGARAQPSERTVWDGVYTDAQAVRGQTGYEENCETCHLRESDTENALLGEAFLTNWREDTVGGLFSKIQATMPWDYPSTLADKTYLDIVAYLLQINHFPEGTKELGFDALEGIRIVGEDGPAPVGSFGLVQVIGCLSEGADGIWILTESSAPVRTSDPSVSTGPERVAAAAAPLGTEVFQLLGVSFGLFDGADPGEVPPTPETTNGHKVEAKGFLIRETDSVQINVTSLRTLATSCAP